MSIRKISRVSKNELIPMIEEGVDLSFIVKENGMLHHSYIHPTECEGYDYLLNTYVPFGVEDINLESDNKFDDICSILPMEVEEIGTLNNLISVVYNTTMYENSKILEFDWFEVTDGSIELTLDYFLENNLDKAIFIIK